MERWTMTDAVQFAIITQVLEGQLSREAACERLGCDRTTLWRKCRRVQQDGPTGVLHGLRGHPSHFACPPTVKATVCQLYATEYQRFGYRVAHFYQDAASRFPQPVHYATVVRWLRAAGVTQRAHKGRRHHSRRPRRTAFGELLQMDTSIHDWLGWRRNVALIATIDDATNVFCGAHLTHADTTLGNFTVLQHVLQTYGLFASLYVDRAPVFKVTRTGHGGVNRVTHRAPYVTQIQRALEALGIELIYAYSPQAKGRIERAFGTFQTRLIPELRKHGIVELAQANAYLHDVFLPQHNARFAADPQGFPSAFVPFCTPVDLDAICCERYALTVPNDHVLSSKTAGVSLKILPTRGRRCFAKAKIELRKHTDGSLSVHYQDQPLRWQPYP